MRKFILCCFIIGVACVYGQTYAASSIEEYIGRYCDDVYPVDDCGNYDTTMQQAHQKISTIANILQTYDPIPRRITTQRLTKKLSYIWHRAGSTEDKLLAAYYLLVLEKKAHMVHDADSILTYLFDDKDTSPSDDGYSSSRGHLRAYGATDGKTNINTRTHKISVEGTTMRIQVQAVHGSKTTSRHNGYRVAAVINGQTYAANYTTNGIWKFAFGPSIEDGDRMTFYLLCKACKTGSTFKSSTALNGWYIVDSETFVIDGSLRPYYDYDHPASRDNYELAATITDRAYDMYGSDVDIEVETRVANRGRYATRLEDLMYTVYVDGHRLSSREYTLRHLRTSCDNRYVSSNTHQDIRMSKNDICRFEIRISIDRDDVEDRSVEIRAEARSVDNRYMDDATDTVRFRVQ